MNNRTAMITGAASGIGKACAIALDREGCTTFLVDMVYPEETARMCVNEARAYKCDLSDYEAVKELVAKTEFWGLDILVSNAGVRANPTPFQKMTPEEWHRVMRNNLDSQAWVLSCVGEQMVRRGGGSIVVVGSMSGIVANKGFQNAHYNASKAATHQLVRSLAVEWAGYGIRCNAVAPGPTETPMSSGLQARNPDLYREFGGRTALGRWGKPEEIAEAVVVLASPKASFITGETLLVDGGYCAW